MGQGGTSFGEHLAGGIEGGLERNLIMKIIMFNGKVDHEGPQ